MKLLSICHQLRELRKKALLEFMFKSEKNAEISIELLSASLASSKARIVVLEQMQLGMKEESSKIGEAREFSLDEDNTVKKIFSPLYSILIYSRQTHKHSFTHSHTHTRAHTHARTMHVLCIVRVTFSISSLKINTLLNFNYELLFYFFIFTLINIKESGRRKNKKKLLD